MSDFYDNDLAPADLAPAIPIRDDFGFEPVGAPIEDPVDIDLTEAQSQYDVPDVDELLEEAIEIVAASKPLPMSTTVKVNRDDMLDILEAAREQLPDELRAARWLLKEREDFLAKARQESEDIINEGRIQVSRLIERQEIVRAADAKARTIVEEARTEARELQRQVEDFCDQKLASFEVVLNRTSQTVKQGREKLIGAAKVTEEEMAHHPLDDPAYRP